MKIAYISNPSLSDVDLSYLSQAQKTMDIDYYLDITPRAKSGAAINIKNMKRRFGVYPAGEYPELSKYSKLVDMSKFNIVNRTASHSYYFRAFIESIRFVRFLNKSKYDIIHLTWYPGYNFFPIYLLRKKLILTVHDPFPHSCVKSKIELFVRNISLRVINKFILLNDEQKLDFIRVYKIKERGKNVYLSKLGRYEYLQACATGVNIVPQKYILFFGSIASHKGLDYLFEAMEMVHHQHPDCKLVVAGRGDFYFDITPYLSKEYFDIRNRFIPVEELADLIRSCQFVVVPYIDATQSGVIMSAFAFNKPCVVTNVGALPSMVKNDKFGCVVASKNHILLSEAISSLLSDPERIKQLSDNIREFYEDGGDSWSDISKGMKTIYDDMLEQIK